MKDPIIRVKQIQRDFDKRKPLSRNDIQFLIDFGMDRDRQHYKGLTQELSRLEKVVGIAVRRETLQRNRDDHWMQIQKGAWAS